MWAEYAEKAVFLYHNSALILGRNVILPPLPGGSQVACLSSATESSILQSL